MGNETGAARKLAARKLFVSRTASVFPGSSESDIERMLSADTATSFRINTLRAPEPGRVLEELARGGIAVEPLEWMLNAYRLKEDGDRKKLVECELQKQGKIFIQNPSSYVPVLALDPQKGERILDMCASPGGKTSLIAARTDNQAELWVNDKIPARVEKLKEVLELLGVRTDRILQESAEYLGKSKTLEGITFDKILLDAQCTGEGLVDLRDPHALENWSISRIEEYSYLQQRMLVSAFRLLKPGGTLVYSTCTFNAEENEKPLNFLLQKFSEAAVLPIELALPRGGALPGLKSWHSLKFDPRLKDAIRIRPDGIMGGFFVCKLGRTR